MTDLETITRLVLLMDAAIPALEAAARAETRREAGKPMREITAKKRVEIVRDLAAEVAEKYGIEL